VYVHVPFCARRCAYCDFSIAVRREVPVGEFIRAIERELALRFSDAEPWPVDTLYLGGGTPSRLGGEGVARLMDALRSHVELAPGAEITMEANPEDLSDDAARRWRVSGVNRISLGAQSFDDRVLTWMHRSHDAAAIGHAVHAARSAGFDNLSLDLIFSLPESLERSWERDVDRALGLEPEHLSLYGLTIEPHTPLGRWSARGDVAESPDDRYESEFLHANRTLVAAGFDHYEVSNFARPGLRARHNSAYWSHVPYAGLGPSAHEFDGARRRWNAAPYADWARRLEQDRDPVEGSELLSLGDWTAEAVYLGLRASGGLSLREGELEHVSRWIDAGWGKVDAACQFHLSPAGWLRLDALAADLTLIRSR
jgi:putative oxygen-independent coproporphyrinogen III oxidase